MLDRLLGRVRLPARAQLSIQTQDAPLDGNGHPTGPGSTHLAFSATGRGQGQQVNYQTQYAGQMLTMQMIMDLLQWMKHTARTFWGSENGGM